MTHLKYLAVGGAILGAVVGGFYFLSTLSALPIVAITCFVGSVAYGLGWSYYYHRSGQ